MTAHSPQPSPAIPRRIRKEVADLIHLEHKVVQVDEEDYILFNVPADNHCLFHALAAILQPIFGCRTPTFQQVREGVIAFYNRCSGRLQQVLEVDFPGIARMDERARKLQRKANEWGEHMDIQAAAILYDVQFHLFIVNRRRQTIYREDIYSYRHNSTRSASAQHSPQVLWFDGRCHFKVAHCLSGP